LFIVYAGNRAGYSGLSSAGHAVQPEDAPFIMPISPCHYLLKDVNSSVAEADWVMLLVLRVKGCLSSKWYMLENI
jgi:hypothetical protein